MSKTAALFILLAAASIPVAAQISEPNAESAYAPPPPGTQPNLPGTFTLELGLNSAPDAPEDFDLALWGSRTVNVYYQHEFRILQSKFSLVPGIGLSLERFKFKNGATLGYADDSLQILLPSEIGMAIRKSQLITNYIDVPVELRFTSNPSDPGRSFKIGIGGRIGYMYDSFTKLKYEENGDTKQLKNKQNWNLNRFRYGVTGRLGIGNFSVFGYYNLTPLFQEGEEPFDSSVPVEVQTMTVGISLSAF